MAEDQKMTARGGRAEEAATRLNGLSPSEGSKRPRRRVGRGIGSGLGKTAGRGHKGQKSRSGGFHKVGFEGGQMPLYRRLPKRGFTPLEPYRKVEIRLSDLERLSVDTIDLVTLKQLGVVSEMVREVKVILSGNLTRKISIQGLRATKGAKAMIEQLGGSVGDMPSKQPDQVAKG